MNRAEFYRYLRSSKSGMFGKKLSGSQVSGMEGTLNAFAEFGDGKDDSLAYMLATQRREVGSGMVPVREGFKKTDAEARAYVQRHYGHKGKHWYCWPAGPYGHVYYGRGIVQNTWYENYVKTNKYAPGVDLVRNPDAMLIPEIGAAIMVQGMLDGIWNGRGHGLRYYLDQGDLKNARRTVNITDHWEEIAGYYREFLAAIRAAGGVPTLDKTAKERALAELEQFNKTGSFT